MRKIVFEKSFKILNFGSTGMQLMFTFSVHTGAQYTVGKLKILLKNKIFAKTASLAIINKISSRSQKNHRILVKLNRKTFFGFKLGLHYQHGSKSHHKLLYSLNRTIHLYFLDVKFQIVIICCFRL